MSAVDDPEFYCSGRACIDGSCTPYFCRHTDGDGRYPVPDGLVIFDDLCEMTPEAMVKVSAWFDDLVESGRVRVSHPLPNVTVTVITGDDYCCRGECCGPGSWCCAHAGPHSHA